MTADDDLTRPIEGGDLRRRAVRGAVATGGAQGLKFLVRLASQILIARLLMPADYGLIAMAGPIIGLLQLVAELGLGQAVIQRAEIRQREVSALFWFGLSLNLGLAAMLALCAPLVATMYGEPRLVQIVLIFAGLLPLTSTTLVPTALMMRNMRFSTMASLDVGPPLLGFAAGYWAALAGHGYWSLVIAYTSEALAQVALTWIFAGWRPGRPTYSREVWAFARVGSHVAGYNLANYVTVSADTFLLGLVGGKVQLGLYDRAYRLVTQPLNQLISPFARVAVPLLTRLMGEPDRYRMAYRAMLEAMLLAGLPAILFLIVYARPLLVLVLGDHWAEVGPVVSWICVGAIASPVYSSTFWLFVTQDRTGEQLKYVWAMAVISVIAFVCGLPWGAPGVAAGAGMGFLLVTTPIVCWGVTRKGPVRPRDLAGILAPIAFAGALSAGALVSAYGYFEPVGFVSLLAVGCGGYLVFACGLALLPAGRRMMADVLAIRSTLRTAG